MLEEYRDASQTMRHYSNLRFAQLTVFVAATGGLWALEERLSSSTVPSAAIEAAGLLVVGVFVLLEERLYMYWNHYLKRAIALERDLGFKQHTERPRLALLKGNVAVRVLFVGAGAFWVTMLIL